MKILIIEGLGVGLPYFQSYYIASELLPKLPAVVPVTRYAWSQSIPAPDKDTVVIGHSFGGNKALNLGGSPKAIVTLDPRSWSCDFIGGGFTAPSGVPVFNFYRKGFMPGYAVAGATNVQLANVGHVNVPGQPEVLAKVLALLKS